MIRAIFCFLLSTWVRLGADLCVYLLFLSRYFSPAYFTVDCDGDMNDVLARLFVVLVVYVMQVEELANKLPGLTALNLDRCTVGDTGVRALSSLTKLEVSGAAPHKSSSFPLACWAIYTLRPRT